MAAARTPFPHALPVANSQLRGQVSATMSDERRQRDGSDWEDPEWEDDQDGIDEDSGNPKAMGFLDHLDELRWTLAKSAGVFLIAALLVAFFLKDFASLLNWPLRSAMGESGLLDGLVTTSPTAVFSVLVQLCFLGGLGLSLPFILYFIAQFVAPALTRRELKLLKPVCLACLGLFLGGAFFSYLVLVPGVIRFSVSLNEMLGLQLLWSADRYYNMLVWMTVGIGMAFQFPMVICLLVYLGLVTTEKLRSGRPYAIVAFFVAGMTLTATWDPVTQTMVALPMWGLYEIAIIVGRQMEKRRADELAEAGVDGPA